MKKVIGVLSLAFALTIGAASDAQAQTKTSSKKKSAIIGGAVGAGTGVIVGKKKAKSAVIGGAVGAGAGYLYGRHKDKKRGVKS